MQINNILIKPLLTEKATKKVNDKVYTFEVSLGVNKKQIAITLENLYKVKVKKIRVVTRQGKQRRVGRKMQAKKLINRKIAYITLKEGKIDLFPQA